MGSGASITENEFEQSNACKLSKRKGDEAYKAHLYDESVYWYSQAINSLFKGAQFSTLFSLVLDDSEKCTIRRWKYFRNSRRKRFVIDSLQQSIVGFIVKRPTKLGAERRRIMYSFEL